VGLWKALFGGKTPKKAASAQEPLDTEALARELRAEGSQAKAGDVTVTSSPRAVFRYVFVRQMAGTPAAALRAELQERGFSGKVADAYITLVKQTMFPGR
jgi:hypothetical protein